MDRGAKSICGPDFQRRALSPEEIKALLDNSGKYRLLWYTMLATGLRRNEAVNLTWDMVKLDEMVIEKPPEINECGRFEIVRLPEELADDLFKLRGEAKGKYVFCSRLGKPYSSGLLRALNRCLRRAGIEKYKKDGLGAGSVDIHSLRTTYISALVNIGVDARTVQELARHRDIKTTMKYYAKVFPKSVRAAVERLPYLRKTAGKQKEVLLGSIAS